MTPTHPTRTTKLALALLMLLCAAAGAAAQGLWLSADAKARIGSRWGLDAEGRYRTAEGLQGTADWGLGLIADYRIAPGLKAIAGYNYIDTHTRHATSDRYITPGYWTSRHRLQAGLQASVRVGRVDLSLRELYQLTHRCHADIDRTYLDGVTPSVKHVAAYNRSHLRSRLMAEYDIRRCPLTPYASFELFSWLDNGFNSQKWRITAGASYKIDRHSSLSLYYRYLHYDKRSADEPRNVIGMGYAYKFKI